MTISFINESISNANLKESLNRTLSSAFRFVQEGQIDVVFDMESPTSNLGKIDVLIFINIIDRRGNYYISRPSNIYLHSLAIGIKFFEMDDVTDVSAYNLYNEEGAWNYKDGVEADSIAFDRFCYNNVANVRFFKSAFFYCVKAKNYTQAFNDDYIFVNTDPLPIERFIDIACRRCQSEGKNGVGAIKLEENIEIHNFVQELIKEAEAKVKLGIVTRRKIDSIRRDSVLVDRILSAMGSRLCIIGGNAGAGKTLALMRIAYRTLSREFDEEGKKRSHNIRILTYNNMLVYDIKNTLKSMGTFSSNNLSVTTLHKFFFKMFKNTPIVWGKYSGELKTRVDDLVKICDERVERCNRIILDSFCNYGKQGRPWQQISQYSTQIPSADKTETDEYLKFLNLYWNDLNIERDLDKMRKQYVEEKKKKSFDGLLGDTFFKEYENILKDLYFTLDNPQRFAEEHDIKSKLDFYKYIYTADNRKPDVESIMEESLQSIESIARSVKWSSAILIDEAQDCSIYEKALLYKTRGYENIVVATGGRDQLIRKAQENDWSILFGQKLEKESITLRRTNWRQKANIVCFLNAFAEQYNLDTRNVQNSKETEERGRVIIDLRPHGNGQLPLDKIADLRGQGIDYGCSDYENIMLLLPRRGYTNVQFQGVAANVNTANTITFQEQYSRELRDFGQREHEGTKDMRFYDCTVNSKSNFIIGQNDTRVLLYDSCRGLETWNAMCIDVDTFYEEKYGSPESQSYARENSGLIQEDTPVFQTRFAAIWCYMAFTRAMDTLYISISNRNLQFSQNLLRIAKSCGNAVEIVE